MTNIVIDTNILIYALDKHSTFFDACNRILMDKNNNLFFTTKTLTEYFAVSSKNNFDRDITFGFYEDFKKNATLLFPDEISLTHFETLLKKYHPKGNRVFDIEIVSVMMANDIDTIATYNKADFKDITEIALLST